MDHMRVAALIIDLLAECRDHNADSHHMTANALFQRGSDAIRQLIELSFAPLLQQQEKAK